MAMFSGREPDPLQQTLRAREKEIRALEEKVAEQEETLQNLNRLLDQQDRSMAALTTFQHLWTTASSAREAAGPFLDLAVRAARCEGGLLALREGAGTHMAVVAVQGDRADQFRGRLFHEDEGIVGEVDRSGQPLLVPDARREPRLRREGTEHLVREPRNAFCVPLIGATRSWGAVLLVNTADRKRFNKADVDLMTIFAVRMARELDREAEFTRAREETARVSALLRVSELLHVAGDRQKTADLLVQLSCRMSRAQGAAVYLLDEGAQLLTCLAASDRLTRPIQVPVGTGAAGWVALEGKALNSAVDADRWAAGQAGPVHAGRAEAVVAVPIRGARRLLGVLEVVNRAGGGQFDSGDVNLLALLAREAGLALDHKQQSVEDQRTILELMRGIAKYLDSKAPHLAGHSERVAAVSRTLAEEMGLSPAESHDAYLAGLLHDLGNVAVEDELFLTSRKLAPEELARMRQHPAVGAEILGGVVALRHLMAGPLYHHERWDGGGYPQGLAGEAIPQLARIVAVAEAFDAIRSQRPYREGMSLPDALAFVRSGEGSVFDPRAVAALVSAYQRGKLPA